VTSELVSIAEGSRERSKIVDDSLAVDNELRGGAGGRRFAEAESSQFDCNCFSSNGTLGAHGVVLYGEEPVLAVGVNLKGSGS
jgi:hypothetical protein